MKPINSQIAISIPIGLGDIFHQFAQLNAVKHLFKQIDIAFYEPLFSSYKNDNGEYKKFITDLCFRFFSNPPFKMVDYDNQPFRNTSLLCSEDRLFPVRPHLRKYLVEPITNNYGDYIILTTKVRQLERKLYLKIKDKLFTTLNALSSKYKFMILGEKEIEYNAEYTHLGSDCVYSLYSDFIDNLPADRIIDLTIPKLGITAPNLSQFLNDCSLMANAKYTMTLGIGGNFSTAISIGNAVSYRKDTDHIANILYNDVPYLDALITQFPERFISKLESL